MQASERKQYQELLVSKALPSLTEKDSVNWQLHVGKNVEEGVVYKGHLPEYGTVWKAQIVMHCSAEQAFHTIVTDGNVSWIPNLSHFEALDKFEGGDIAYQIAKGQGGISDRDFLTFRHIGEFEKGLFATATCSFPGDNLYNFKPPKKCVRGEILPGGYSWRQLDDPNKCLFTNIYNIDLKGYFIRSLVNLVVSSFLLDLVKKFQHFSINCIVSIKVPSCNKENDGFDAEDTVMPVKATGKGCRGLLVEIRQA